MHYRIFNFTVNYDKSTYCNTNKRVLYFRDNYLTNKVRHQDTYFGTIARFQTDNFSFSHYVINHDRSYFYRRKLSSAVFTLFSAGNGFSKLITFYAFRVFAANVLIDYFKAHKNRVSSNQTDKKDRTEPRKILFSVPKSETVNDKDTITNEQEHASRTVAADANTTPVHSRDFYRKINFHPYEIFGECFKFVSTNYFVPDNVFRLATNVYKIND